MEKNMFKNNVFRMFRHWQTYDEQEGTERTWCNYFVTSILLSYGYTGFTNGSCIMDLTENFPQTANAMCNTLESDKEYWKKIELPEIKELLEKDDVPIIVAAQQASDHGHVCILLPMPFVFSGKWQKDVPQCANIGKKNSYGVGVNMAFKTEPSYYVYTKEGL